MAAATVIRWPPPHRTCLVIFIAATALSGPTLAGGLALSLALTAPAFADGGRGGGNTTGVSGGTDNATVAGGVGSVGVLDGVIASGGGGGGAGVTGGVGGHGFNVNNDRSGAGGAGGTAAGASGGNGGDAVLGGDGGGGGGGGAHGAVVSTSGALSSSIGGNGGSGGNGPTGNDVGGAGGGGAGGHGVVVNGSGLSLTSSGTVSGGNGGNGGIGGGAGGNGVGSGGGGGTGGIGLDFVGTANSLVNTGSITGGAGGAGGAGTGFFSSTGGAGGAGGAGITGSGMSISNNGTISGGNGGAGGASAVDQNGTNGAGGVGISGSGLTVINSGTLRGGLASDGTTRANAITFTGGINTLELQAGYNIIGNAVAFSAADTLQLGGTNNAAFDVSQIGGSAQYQGFGIFQKTGSSTWTLTGTNSAALAWTINAGTLSVNATVSNWSFTVPTGSTIAGNGTVGSLTIGGNVEPGNSIGTLTVTGSLVLTSAATYVVDLSLNQADRINDVGTTSAKLGGTVEVLFAGSPTARSYNILHAAVGFGSTTFSGVTSNVPGFAVSLGYTPTDVLLNVTAALGGPQQAVGLSQNQQGVASAINNFFNNGGTLTPNFGALFGLTGANLANALTVLSGEVATGAQQSAFQLTTQFLGLMLDPFVDDRAGVGGAYGHRESLPEDTALAYAKVLRTPVYKATPFEQRWSVWGGGYGGYNKTSGDPVVVGSHDLPAHTAGGAAGLDYRVAPGTVVGFALAGGGTGWSLAQNLGSGRSDAFQAGIYGTTRYGPAYLAAALAYTEHWMSTDRYAFAGDYLTANFNAHSFGGRVETGYRVPLGLLALTPYAAVQAQNFHTPTYSETDVSGGGFGLSYNAHNATDSRSELGARFDRAILVNWNAVLALRGKVAWAHDWVTDSNLLPTFEALPGASFIVQGATPAKNSALASAGAELRLINGVSLLGKFDGEFASHSQTYAGTATLRYTW
jgi:outer membrane autotransporter protein